MRGWLSVAGVTGAVSVALGAWLAHSGGGLALDRLALLGTAQSYALWHSLALGMVAALGWNGGPRVLHLAGAAFLLGLLLFSGGLALQGLTGLSLGPLVPVGGLGFILGWLLLGLAGWQGLRRRGTTPS